MEHLFSTQIPHYFVIKFLLFKKRQPYLLYFCFRCRIKCLYGILWNAQLWQGFWHFYLLSPAFVV